MPSLELAAGQVLTAAHTNTYWMRQVIASGLSSARPTGYEGRAVYDTDTDALMIYASAGTGWRPPWNLPWGHVGKADATANTATTSASFTDVAGASVSFTALPTRWYDIIASGHIVGAAVNALAGLAIVDGAGLQLGDPGRSDTNIINAAVQVPFTVRTRVTGKSGAQTAKLRIASLVGSISVEVWNNVGKASITVTDIGPSAAPA